MRTRFARILARAIFTLAALPAHAARKKLEPNAPPFSCAFILDAGRILLEADATGLDGQPRKTLVWFNMGMAKPIATRALYRELGLDRGASLKLTIAGRMFEARAQDVVDGDGGFGAPDFAHLFAPRAVELMAPAQLLQSLAVTLDYRRRRLTLSDSILSDPSADHSVKASKIFTQDAKGVAIKFLINRETGIIALPATIDDRSYYLALDAGSGYSWIDGAIAAPWLARHPDWLRARGAIGQANANMVDFDFEKNGIFARLPQIALDGLELRDIGVLATAPLLGEFGRAIFGDPFWSGWSKNAPAPVIGWLGANALKPFILTIDYPAAVSYWIKQDSADLHENDQPAVTIVRSREKFFVGGVPARGEAAASSPNADQRLNVGDEILAVDDVPTSRLSRGDLLNLLHGRPHESRRLSIERAGARMTVTVPVLVFD